MSFEESLQLAQPPESFSLPLQALWWDAKGDWHQAHNLLQDESSREGDWVHAYLHRKEGDLGNAAYWYARAGQPKASGSLDEERSAIATVLLGTSE